MYKRYVCHQKSRNKPECDHHTASQGEKLSLSSLRGPSPPELMATAIPK